ncbi:MAG: asparagine synthase (glutamine-hydrolyzing) [Gemmatimonadales bacterium]|nr:asparagine synthase (glutamine-hydrolyzing) [Gemmatimonadales bacterium]
MCGLAGRFRAGGLPPAPGWAAAADRLLAHRGPDGSGHLADQHCELVHRRLALIDLSPAGSQPMANETGDIHVAFNGEIYNHRDLRAPLEARGHTFRSTADTEVLLHLYEERGEHLVELLRGIFAFAIYDAPRRRLLLARDRFGVKPLFYATVGGQLVFASEIKAITALPGFRPTLDRQACCDFLGLSYIPEPATGFQEIRALPPGSVLVESPDGRRIDTYHTVTARPDAERSLEATVDVLSERLLAAVRSQSVADVPVAALLSGGIDSSLVVAAHRRAVGERPTTFNVRFPDASHDETPLAVQVANHVGTRHHVIELGDWGVSPDGLMDIARHFDQPFADTSCIPMYWVSRAIRERGIVCTLSGDGGDEAFGGYGRFWRANRLARLMALPAWVRSAAAGTGRLLAPVTRDWGRQVAKAVALAEAGRSDSSILLAGLSNYLSEDQKAALLLPAAAQNLQPVYRHFDGYRPAGVSDLEELSRRMTETLFAVALPSDMLRKVDMMSMRASIEVRVPLLDETMVDLGLTLPHRLKTDGREGKLVLRALAKQWLPRPVARHPKHGFSIPLDVMATPAVHTRLEDLLLASDARTGWFLNRALVRTWLSRFRQAAHHPRERGGMISRGGLYQRVFTLLSLELWLRDHQLSW